MPRDDPTNDKPESGLPHPEAEPQIAEVLAVVGEVLGPDVVGAYLHGSAVLGGLRPRSDIDILVVSLRPTTHPEKRRLVDRLLTISAPRPPGPRHPVELTVVVQSEVRPWRYPPRLDLQYGDWLRPELERGDVAPGPTTTDPDLASLITMVLLANRPLLGPPPAEVLDPVPYTDYIRAITGDLERLLGDLDGDTRNVLLTLARIWSTLATDAIRPKDAAAAWTILRLPAEHRLVLNRARAIYLGEADEGWDDLAPRLRPCADYMADAIKRLAAHASPSETARTLTLLR